LEDKSTKSVSFQSSFATMTLIQLCTATVSILWPWCQPIRSPHATSSLQAGIDWSNFGT